jgi:hypothetical protein
MAFEQSRDFTKRRVRRGGDDVTSHNVPNLLCIRLDVVVCERRPPNERLEPPGPASLRSRFRPPHQVAFAHDPDQLTPLSDNGTAPIRLASNVSATSTTQASGPTVTTSVVMTSAALIFGPSSHISILSKHRLTPHPCQQVRLSSKPLRTD